MLQTILKPHLAKVTHDFIERYKISFSELSQETYRAFEENIKEILATTLERDKEALKASCKKLAALNFENHLPYIILLNELNTLKNRLTSILLQENAKEEVFELHSIYNDLENVIAYEHLGNYMNKLFHANNIRINSLKDLMKKNLVVHYQKHLEWLNSLTDAILKQEPQLIPELNANMCEFGQWLASEGKATISNNSKFTYIQSIHATLHSLAKAIQEQMGREYVNFNILASYLEKCEFISLSIGTELALIDNRLLIKESSKDTMTGALNRNSLDAIFMNQYELALATDSSFILAMCDLDHFKTINDTYGHTTGDKILKEFVAICKNSLRDSDIIVRYGGEEFIILMSNTTLEHGVAKLESIRKDFHRLCCTDGEKVIGVSVSMGVTHILPTPVFSASSIDIKEFIEPADKLLYQAKNGGRNRIEYLR